MTDESSTPAPQPSEAQRAELIDAAVRAASADVDPTAESGPRTFPVRAAACRIDPSSLPIGTSAVEQESDGVHLEMMGQFEVPVASGARESEQHLMVTLRPSGRLLSEETSRASVHVVLALDVSASMNHPERYPVVLEALRTILRDAASRGEGGLLLSVVVYGYGAEIVLRDRLLADLTPDEVVDAIDNSPLRFTRYTDFAGALERAGRIAYDSHRRRPAVPVRICVFTDGAPQDVERSRSVLSKIARLPADVDVLAFGPEADVPALLDLVAGHRGGTVKRVRGDTVQSVFDRLLWSSRRLVAKRAIVQFDLHPGVVGGAAYRFRPARHAFGAAAFRAGRSFRVDLGSLQADREYSLVFQLRVPRTFDPASQIGELVVKLPGHGGPRVYRRGFKLRRASEERRSGPNAAVTDAVSILQGTRAADDARAQVAALRARHKLYQAERRDPYIIELVERAIETLERAGDLSALSPAERASLQAHTCTVASGAGA